MRRLRSYIPEEQLFGYRTLVTDKSRDGLPVDMDREKEVALPPGSATPNSPLRDDMAEGLGRVLASPRYNGPGTGEPGPAEHPRTIGVPGADIGVPTKFDYNMPTRRTMTGVHLHVAYKSRIPWRRQKRQPTFKKLDDHQYYERNKSKIRQRLKVWYKSVRNNQNFKTQKKNRREDPEKYERKKVGDVEIECCGVMAKEAYTPWSLGKKRHRTRGPTRQRRRRNYIRNRARAHRQHHIWYQKNKNKPAFKRRQRLRRKNPSRFRMRPAALNKEIWVMYGPAGTSAIVCSIDENRVVFKDTESGMEHSLTPQAFMQAVSFLDEPSLHAMLDELDEYGGEDPYGDPTIQDLLEVRALFGVSGEAEHDVCALAEDAMKHWDVDSEMVSRVASAYLRGGEILLYDQRSPEEGHWEKPDNVPSGSPVGPGHWTKRDPAQTQDPTPGGMPYVNVSDSGGSGKVVPEHLKYGSMSPVRLFKGLRTPDSDYDIGLWHTENKLRYRDSWFLAWWDYDWDMMGGVIGEGGNNDPEMDIAEKVALANGADRTRDPSGIPRFEWESQAKAVRAAQQIVRAIQEYRRSHDKVAITLADITHRTSNEVTKRSKGVQVRLSRADPSNGIWTFKASGSEGRTYTVRVKAEAKGNMSSVQKAQLRVSCDCDFFRWQGCEYHAKKEGFLYGKPRGTATRPVEKDPEGNNLVCRHVLASLALAKNYKIVRST